MTQTTNPATTYVDSFMFANSLVEVGVPDDMASLVRYTINALEQAEGNVRSYADTVARRVAETLRSLDNGYNVSSTGAIQSAAPYLDTACALRQAALEMRTAIFHTIGRMYPAAQPIIDAYTGTV